MTKESLENTEGEREMWGSVKGKEGSREKIRNAHVRIVLCSEAKVGRKKREREGGGTNIACVSVASTHCPGIGEPAWYMQ